MFFPQVIVLIFNTILKPIKAFLQHQMSKDKPTPLLAIKRCGNFILQYFDVTTYHLLHIVILTVFKAGLSPSKKLFLFASMIVLQK